MLKLCLERIASRSRYDALQPRSCQLELGHPGKHDEFPFLAELAKIHSRVAHKIVRDSTMTTGAAWKSEDAGPNRILRWVMLQPDSELLAYGINMSVLKPQVVAKLREKAATYTDCLEVAKKLTWLVYQMPAAPPLNVATTQYLEAYFGPLVSNSGVCLVCRAPLSFTLFAEAVRGKAAIETSHANPRQHNAQNVGFAHRECNIAQGGMTLSQFYQWLEGILERVRNS